MIVIVLVPLLSVAVGASKVQGLPNSIVLLVLLQVITGAVVSTTVTFWLQEAFFSNDSAATDTRVVSKLLPHRMAVLVTVLTIVIVLVPPVSVAVGASKVQALPNSTVLLVLPQIITAAVVLTTVTFWLQAALLPQASVATHSRVASKEVPQWPAVLVTVLTIVIVLVPAVSVAIGGANGQGGAISNVLVVVMEVITE